MADFPGGSAPISTAAIEKARQEQWRFNAAVRKIYDHILRETVDEVVKYSIQPPPKEERPMHDEHERARFVVPSTQPPANSYLDDELTYSNMGRWYEIEFTDRPGERHIGMIVQSGGNPRFQFIGTYGNRVATQYHNAVITRRFNAEITLTEVPR